MKCVLDCHCHTIACGHAYSTVKEYAEEAAKKKLDLISITEHGPKMPGMTSQIFFLNLKAIPNTLYGVEILTGVELNIMNSNGDVDLENNVLETMDVVIASLHDVCIESRTIQQNTAAVINAMKNPYIRIIGHLGDPRYPVDIDAIVIGARDNQVALEINEASLSSKDGYRSGGEKTILEMAKKCKKYGVPVILGSDAHFCSAIGGLACSKKIAEAAGLEEKEILNTSVDLFKKFLNK